MESSRCRYRHPGRLARAVLDNSGDHFVTSKRALCSAVTLLVGLALAGAALADNYKFHRFPGDDALAAAIVVKEADAPTGLKLTGGPTKPDETPNTDSCNGKLPKESDLTVTGDAATDYTGKAVEVHSQVQLFKTAAMAATDVRRQMPMLRSPACGLETAKRHHLELLSYTPLGRARCACDDSESISFETPTKKANLHVFFIFTAMRRGRVEATIMTGVGKSTSDKNFVAVREALVIQGSEILAVSKRLHIADGS
jgi:hypothetical protein